MGEGGVSAKKLTFHSLRRVAARTTPRFRRGGIQRARATRVDVASLLQSEHAAFSRATIAIRHARSAVERGWVWLMWPPTGHSSEACASAV